MILRAVGGLIILGACFFLPAWTIKYWQAWLYLAVIFDPLLIIIIYFLKKNPEFLVRRMKVNEKATEQKWIVGLSGIPLTLAFILPGFDVRLGWSKVPDWLVWMSAFLVFAGYVFIILVFLENNFASRVVEVTEEQKVIQTGPYSLVCHPM
jgi:protein-S-isoprenylcysteine O-methyltransferase Ste14